MTIPVRALTALLVGATVVLLNVTAGAQEPARRRPEQVPPTGVDGPAQTTQDAGVAVRTLDALTNRSTEGLTFEYRSDGTVGLDLQGRFQNVMLATIGPDGRVEAACVTEGHDHPALKALPLWTPSRSPSAHRLNAITHLPAPIVVAAPSAPLEEK